jgi:hypothetical protein
MRNTDYDITDRIGPSHAIECDWPMYSYERPSYILWNAIAANLHGRGWSDAEIKQWLQSKEARWALDGSLGEALIELGNRFADTELKEDD